MAISAISTGLKNLPTLSTRHRFAGGYSGSQVA